MIYDCFQFFNELDLLEVRLEELYPVVDKFVICESTKTFSGNDKELRYLKHIDRYKKYQDKIKYIVYDNFDRSKIWTYQDNWILENDQRRYLLNGIDMRNLKDDDLILSSDLDEIPKRSVIENIKKDFFRNPEKYQTPITICSQMFYGKLTYKVVEPEEHLNWRGTVLITGRILKSNTDLQYYRNYSLQCKTCFPSLENNGSWHFSYMGSAQDIIYKIESYAHQESNTVEIKNKIEENLNNMVDLFNRPDYKLEKVEMDDSYPELIKNNLDRFKHLYE